MDRLSQFGLWEHGTGFLSMRSMRHLSLLLSRDSIGAGRLFSVCNSSHFAYNCCNSCHLAYCCCISAYCAFMLPIYQCLVYAFPLYSSHYDPLHFGSRTNQSISAKNLFPSNGVIMFEQRRIHRTIEHDNHSWEACTVLLCNIS